MQTSDRELSAQSRRYIILTNAGAPLVMVAIAWALYASVALFDIDLVELLKRRNRAPREFDATKTYLWIAIIGTAICSGYAWISIRRALGLAQNGESVVGKVVKVGKISAHGMVRVDYEYVVDGKTYRQCLSCFREVARDYESGSVPLEVVYDPRKPKRVMLKSDVFRKSSSVVDEAQDSRPS